ncbi:peptidylprolyl isomerase [Porticoccaceae bacterium]|nr:peptidylprolyl isomerase [Porticoccaceae bacterium]MDA9569659.1 peptidylprolyl isomerase [Porticoccaceae bacterium]
MNLWKIFNLAQRKTIYLSVLLGLILTVSAEAKVAVLDRVAAIVNDDIVLQSELNQRTAAIYVNIQESGTQPPAKEVLKKQVLERLISERIQLNIGYNAGVRISENEIDKTMARLAAGSNLSMQDYLASANAGGTSIKDLRQQIANEMIMMQVQQGSVMRGIHISEQELNNFLNSEEGKLMNSPDIMLGQILISVPSSATVSDIAAAQKKLDEIIVQISQGADFKQLAIANSDDQSALEGGDLGWRKQAQLPSLFTDALEGLEPGEISNPVRSGAGFHLLKLYDQKGGEEKLIEQHFSRHILLTPNEIRNEDDTVALLNEIRKKLQAGEEFISQAKEYSEDPGSALKGGELGWSTPGSFVPIFEQTMNSIALNDISEPFKSQFGWHILQVTDRRMQDFSDDILRNRADNLLRQRKYSEELQVWLQKIRDEAYIEIKEI